MSDDLIQQLGREAAKAAPPVVVTLYALVGNALPIVIGLATLCYLVLQIAYLGWKFQAEVRRRREVDKAMSGPVADYKPRIPK